MTILTDGTHLMHPDATLQRRNGTMKITVPVISHRYGVTVSACSSLELANAKLAALVNNWWDLEMPRRRTRPSNQKTMVKQYLDHVEPELVVLEEVEVDA